MDKATAREIVNDLCRVRQELGRVPNRVEYCGADGKAGLGRFSSLQIMAAFGSYALLVKASGLEYSAKGKKEAIRQESYEHLQAEIRERKSIVIPPQVCHRVLIIGDTHFPYTHVDAVQWLIALNRKYKFDKVLHAGDELDYHAMSFHDSDPDALSAGHELDAAIRMMEPLYKEFPVMTLADSNHGSMVHRKAKHHGFPRRVIRSYQETIDAPKTWVWQEHIRWQSSNGHANLLVHSLGSNVLGVAKFKGINLVQGHHHSAHSIQKWHNDEKDTPLFAAQTGCLIDDVAYAMAYNKTTKERPIMGSLAIFDGIPKLLPMLLDARGRWTGVLP